MRDQKPRGGKKRFQVLLACFECAEGERDYDHFDGAVIYAVRATSGHAVSHIDPQRIAAPISQALYIEAPGMRRVTKRDGTAAILKDKLKAGAHFVKGGRMDVHFSPIFPLDSRSLMTKKRTHGSWKDQVKIYCIN